MSSPTSAKRKRDEDADGESRKKSSADHATLYDDILVILEAQENSSPFLDHAIGKDNSRTIRDRLRQSDYETPEELRNHIETVSAHLIGGEVPNSIEDRRSIATLTASLRRILRSEIERTNAAQPHEPKPALEPAGGFPDRFPESQVLFTSSVVGPLFSSATNIWPNGVAPDLPPCVHVSKVLPTSAEDTRVLGDLRQEHTSIELPSVLNARRCRLPTSKTINSSAYGSLGLVHDRANAVLDDKVIALCRTARNAMSTQEDAIQLDNENENDPLQGHESEGANFGLTEDVLNLFVDSQVLEDDVSVLLCNLAQMQEQRLIQSPFSEPGENEIMLAQSISDKLQSLILGTNLTPRQLAPRGVKSSYTMARLTPSYAGTLPPTIAQAMKSSLMQSVPIPDSPLGCLQTGPSSDSKPAQTAASALPSGRMTPLGAARTASAV